MTRRQDADLSEALDAKREEIAALIAAELGFGDLAGLSEEDRAAVDRQTSETIEGRSDEAADCSVAHVRLNALLDEYRVLQEQQELRADQDNVRLAERGEVFAPEDDA